MGLPNKCIFLKDGDLGRILSRLSDSGFEVTKNDDEDSFEITIASGGYGVTLWNSASRDGGIYISIMVSCPTDKLMHLFFDVSRLITELGGRVLGEDELLKVGPYLS